MDYKNNQPFIKKGLEVSQISFSGGRVAASIANHGGLTHINYYGNQRFGDVYFYKADPISAWGMLYRPGVAIDGKMYMLDFNDTLIYPFGYTSYCSFDGLEFKHGMYLLNDTIIFSLDIITNPQNKKVSFKLINTVTCTRVNKATRTWQRELTEGIDLTCVTDKYPDDFILKEKEEFQHTLAQTGSYQNFQPTHSDTWIGVAASSDLKFKENPSIEGLHKHYYSAECSGQTCFYSLSFGHESRESFISRAKELQKNALVEIAQLVGQYDAKLEQSKIIIENQTIQSMLSNIGPFLDSLKVKDIPGGMRAADSGYWIWGWDTMVHADAFGFAGDVDYLVQVLDFYKKTADPDWGIFHEMLLDQRPLKSMAFSAQCLYAITLYYAYIFSGDKKILDTYLPFATWIVNKAGDDEVADSGLLKGVALYPDHPEDLEQDGNDLSSFNNSIYYQSLKVMAELYQDLGDTQTAAEFETKAKRTCKGFERFYDQEKHYFYDSISSIDFSPRKHYPIYAILWLTPFAKDLVAGKVNDIAHFMYENFTAKYGLRLLPTWDSRFMYDGSQLGMYMPVVENFYREILNMADYPGNMAHYFGNMEFFWDQLCIPEALTCEYENHCITPDNPGRKQAFCGKAWLTGFCHIAAGININTKGLSFSASQFTEISIQNLKIRDCSINIEITGNGDLIDQLILDGEPVSAPFFIPFDKLKATSLIQVKRK